MISLTNGIDEPDVIDLTKLSDSSYDLIDRPLRPPSPFADEQIVNTKPMMAATTHRSRDKSPRSSSQSRTTRIKTHWQQTLHRFLKRKKNVYTPYHFGQGEPIESRTQVKHVHWIDETDQMKLNLCQRLMECLKLLVETVMDNDKSSDQDEYIDQCRIIINELSSCIETKELERHFRRLFHSIDKQDLRQVLERQTTIDDLISETICNF